MEAYHLTKEIGKGAFGVASIVTSKVRHAHAHVLTCLHLDAVSCKRVCRVLLLLFAEHR